MSWPATRRTIPNVEEPALRIAHLYADEMNIYGDRGNILTLVKRAEGQGVAARVQATGRGPGLQPLGRVLRGAGNNGEDGFEGVASGNVFGTYLHGSLLPKNPHFADLLLSRALRRHGSSRLELLDDTVEMSAHRSVRERVTSR